MRVSVPVTLPAPVRNGGTGEKVVITRLLGPLKRRPVLRLEEVQSEQRLSGRRTAR